MRKRILLFILMSLLVSMFIIGCSSGESVESNGGDKNTSKPSSNSSQSNTLVFGRGGDSVSLDPAVVTDMESEKPAQNILETLVAYDDMSTEVKPLLAKEWDYSEDGLTYTFKLNEGIKFHDGTDFNAEAVVYNFERWMNAGEDEQGQFGTYGYVFGGFSGDEGHMIKSVKAEDDYTVTFTLNQPLATFIKNLAMTPFSISSPEAIESLGEKYGDSPVGTGPFVFDEWVRNDKIVLNRNENYWQEGYPKLDSVIFKTIPDNSTRLNALLTGEIDMMDGLNPSDTSQVEEDENLQLITRPSLNTGYLGFTVNRPPFDNKLVRKALNHAIDREGIIAAFFEGQATPAKNPIPPAVEGYNEDLELYPYDLEKAKQLLDEAGYSDGFEMELWAMPVARPYMPNAQKVAEVLQASFAQIGVEAEIVSYEWATYLEKVVKGEADAFMLGWSSNNGDADDFLYNLLDKDNIGSLNSSHYINDDLHEILIKARTTPDQQTRIELYYEAQELIYEDAPWAPLVHSKPALAAKANIEGFLPHPTEKVYLREVYYK
jgi:peptide/nickel transport system substrate-binding protein